MVRSGRLTRGVQLVVLAVGATVGLATSAVIRQSAGYSIAGDSALRLTLELAAGGTLLVAGVIAVARPSRRGFGVTLSLASLAWFAAEWNNPGVGSSWAFTAGLLLSAIGPVLVADAALRYPNRHLGRPGSVAVAVGYVSTVGLGGVATAMFLDPVAGGCYGCPANLVLIRDRPEAAGAAARAAVYAGVGWVLILFGLLGWRLARSSGVQRRVTWPVTLPAMAYLLVVGLDHVSASGRGGLGPDTAGQRRWMIEAGLLILVGAGTGWSYVRRRRTRSAIARMVAEASDTARPGGLDRSLGSALGDDSLRVLYPFGDDRWIDGAGRSAELGDRGGTTRLTRGGTMIAVLTHERTVLDEADVVDEVTGAAGLALDHQRLQAQRQAQLGELRASRARIVAVADDERRRLERDLHDGAQQHIVALSLAIRLAQVRAGEEGGRLAEAQAEVTAAMAGLRRLARGLFPRELGDEGLSPALDTLAEEAALAVTVDAPVHERLPPAVEVAAYVTVAYRLAHTAAQVAAVSVRRDGDRLRIEIEDDGPPGDLLMIEDRIVALGGTLSVETSREPGTRIRAELPCAS